MSHAASLTMCQSWSLSWVTQPCTACHVLSTPLGFAGCIYMHHASLYVVCMVALHVAQHLMPHVLLPQEVVAACLQPCIVLADDGGCAAVFLTAGVLGVFGAARKIFQRPPKPGGEEQQ